ncbi:MAG: hypothetical protein GX130_05580 [Candidatus Hydrogenedens sp.]|jgi:hypothetical protein|nr:hypothetical protein [Candidatus Hydrogenedens sp.]
MLQTIQNGLLGGAIFFGLVMAWLGVQHVIRQGNGKAPDFDVLDDPEHGCSHCSRHKGCGSARR